MVVKYALRLGKKKKGKKNTTYALKFIVPVNARTIGYNVLWPPAHVYLYISRGGGGVYDIVDLKIRLVQCVYAVSYAFSFNNLTSSKPNVSRRVERSRFNIFFGPDILHNRAHCIYIYCGINIYTRIYYLFGVRRRRENFETFNRFSTRFVAVKDTARPCVK